MSNVCLTINNRLIEAMPGDTILRAAESHGIRIPTLCHHPGLRPAGCCRICMVEVAGALRPLPACATTVTAGMVVTTDSEKIRRERRMIVELLLAERNHTCPVCVMNGACELQKVSQELAIDHNRYHYRTPLLPVDLSHRRYGIDHNRCILCRRCVRCCDEIEGAHTWDISGRGVDSMVISDLAQPWGESSSCTDCGKCVQACPTGALFEKGANPGSRQQSHLERLKEWRERKPE